MVWPARSLESQQVLRIRLEDVAGALHLVGETPGRLELAEHRQWSVALVAKALDAAIWDELARLEVPGVHHAAAGKATPGIVARAAELPTLRRLSLSGGVRDDALASLGPRPLLYDVHVDSLKLTTAGLESLEAPGLVRLTLRRCSKVRDLSRLSEMQLRRLSLREARVSQKLIKSLPVLPGLTHLDLCRNKITAKMLRLLAERLPNLRELIVEPKQGEGDPLLEGLAGFTQLEALTVLGPRRAEAADLTPLTALTKLRSLDLDAQDMGDLSALPSLTGLQRLVVHRPDDRSLGAVATAEQLRELALIYPEPGTTASGLAAVAQLARLERLDLRGSRVDSPGALLDIIHAMCPAGLRRLRFSESWRYATEILPRLDLPGVEVLQEPLALPGHGSSWVL